MVMRIRTDLVDTAHTETEGTTLDTSPIHVITNEQDQLENTRQKKNSRQRTSQKTYTQQLLEFLGIEQRLPSLRKFPSTLR